MQLSYPTEMVTWCICIFINNKQLIAVYYQLEVKPQTHNLANNLNRNAWVISTLPIDNTTDSLFDQECIPPLQIGTHLGISTWFLDFM